MIGWHQHTNGFTAFADKALADGQLSPPERTFLKDEFGPARERMTGFATTSTTVGTLVLALVGLLVGFSKGTHEQASQLVTASQNYQLLQKNCSDSSTDAKCTAARLAQAKKNVDNAQVDVGELGRLNSKQVVAGALVLIGFLFGLAGILTSPVAGPDFENTGPAGVTAWKAAVKRLERKRNWIITALAFQGGAVVCIFWVAIEAL